MLDNKTKFIFIILILVGNWLIGTRVTSADLFAERRAVNNGLKATTLSFAIRTPFNSDRLSNLFMVNGIQPDGFEIRATRLVKDGKMDVTYQYSVEKIGGDDAVCNALQLNILLNAKEVYKGPLLSAHFDSTLKDGIKDTYIYMVSLDDKNSALQQKNCEFKFVFHTSYPIVNGKPVGLWAKGELPSIVSSGNW